MDIPASMIDPATAPAGETFVVGMLDDDWDHWNHLGEATTYLGQRASTGRWTIRDRDWSEPAEWGYADDEVTILGRPGTVSEDAR